MNYLHVTFSLTLALVLLGAACTNDGNDSNESNDGGIHCQWIADCPCQDGTTQTAGCVGPPTCADACSDHGGATVEHVDEGDAGDGG